MLPAKQKKAYASFYNATANNAVLDQKTTIMIQLAASMSIGCYP
jgi:hypothetical protein